MIPGKGYFFVAATVTSGPHLVSYPVCTQRVLSRSEELVTHLHSVPRVRMCVAALYISS